MKAEPKTAGLGPCQTLVALGVVMDTYFMHHKKGQLPISPREGLTRWEVENYWFPAPTVGELLEVAKSFVPCVEEDGGRWEGSLYKHNEFHIFRMDYNPADALILCICEAIEQGHITAAEINGGEG